MLITADEYTRLKAALTTLDLSERAGCAGCAACDAARSCIDSVITAAATRFQAAA